MGSMKFFRKTGVMGIRLAYKSIPFLFLLLCLSSCGGGKGPTSNRPPQPTPNHTEYNGLFRVWQTKEERDKEQEHECGYD